MLASLALSFQQLASLALQFSRSEFQGAVFTIELTTQVDEIVHFFFERQDEVIRHEGYTALVGSQHYNARPFIGSMCGARAGGTGCRRYERYRAPLQTETRKPPEVLLDALGAFEDMPTWDDAADSLFNAGQTLNPSALHGAMAGLLGAGFSPKNEHHFAATVAALEKSLAIDLTGDLVDFVSRLSLATLSAIQDADYTFQPLLPADDASLEERLLSVSEWSRGFLSGFTQGITQREATGDPIPGMTADALKDMAAIAQVDPEETDSDEAERQLEDIVEYIRFAAINIVTEAQALQEASMTGSTP